MRLHSVLLASLLLATVAAAAPRTAAADRLTFGVSLGQRDDQQESTRGIYGELRLFRRVGVQVEMAHANTPDGSGELNRLSGALVLGLAPHGRIGPVFLAGLGTERISGSSGIRDARLFEVGAGLRVRITGALSVSFDARLGERDQVDAIGFAVPNNTGARPPILLAPFGRSATGYTALRAGIGVTF